MTICACEQGSAEKEEGGGEREEKSQWKSMPEQASVNSFTFKAFFSINPGFQPTKHEPLCLTQSKHNGSVVSCGNLF